MTTPARTMPAAISPTVTHDQPLLLIAYPIGLTNRWNAHVPATPTMTPHTKPPRIALSYLGRTHQM